MYSQFVTQSLRDFDQAEFFGENAEGQFGNSLDKNGYVYVPDK